MGFKMSGSPAKTGGISGTAGHSSALKMRASENAASALKQKYTYKNKKGERVAVPKEGLDATGVPSGQFKGLADDKATDAVWKKADKKSGNTLNELVDARKGHKKGSAEYAEIQNKINSSLGSKKVHKGTKVNKKGETVETKPKGTTTRKADGATVKKGLGAQKGKTLTYTDKAAEKVKIEKANVKIKEGKSTKDKNKRDEGQLEKGEIKSGRDNAKTGTMLSRALARRKVKRNARQLAKRAKKNEETPAKKALVGNQKNLPEHLKAKIDAAPGKMYGKSMAKKYDK